MLRMSFLGHLEELRARIIRMLMGLGIAFVLCVGFAPDLWKVVSAPAMDALRKIGIKDPHLVIIEPMENFSIIWVKLPLVISLFVASPWVLYQIWAFIAPGLYKRERRWAIPFVLTTAGLFITGGLFAYFIAFRYGLAFLLGIGLSGGVQPMSDDHQLLRFICRCDAWGCARLRTAGDNLLPHAAASRFVEMADAAFAVAAILAIVILAAIVTPHAGCLQPDAVRGADVPVVLRRRVRGLSAGDEAGGPGFPMA